MFSKTTLILAPLAIVALLSGVATAAAAPGPALQVRGDSAPVLRRGWGDYDDGKHKKGKDWDDDYDHDHKKGKHGKGKHSQDRKKGKHDYDHDYLVKRCSGGGKKDKHDDKSKDYYLAARGGDGKHGKDWDWEKHNDKDHKGKKGKKGKHGKGKD